MGTALFDFGNGEFGRVYSSRGFFGGRTEHPDVLGTDNKVIPNLPKVRVSVLRFYESYKSVVYRFRAGVLISV